MLRGSLLYVVFLTAALFTSACAHDPYQERCSQTGWYDQAREEAAQGKNLPDSELLRACTERIGAKFSEESAKGFAQGKAEYCSTERARSRAQNGQAMGAEFCGPEFKESFAQLQLEGLVVFCSPVRARLFALSGNKYAGQCPSAMEKPFLKVYTPARREFLIAKISKNNEYLQQLDAEVLDVQKQRVALAQSKPVITFNTSPGNPKVVNVNGANGYALGNDGGDQVSLGTPFGTGAGQTDLQNKNNSMESLQSRNDRDRRETTDSDLVSKTQRMLSQQNQIRTQNREYLLELESLKK
jgi:hypothetical protein